MTSHKILSDEELKMLLSTEGDKENNTEQLLTSHCSYLPRSMKTRKKRSFWQKLKK